MTPLLAITIYLLIGVIYGGVIWARQLRRAPDQETEVHRRAVATARHLPRFVVNVFLWPVAMAAQAFGALRAGRREESAGRR